jgi:hypothetical protein
MEIALVELVQEGAGEPAAGFHARGIGLSGDRVGMGAGRGMWTGPFGRVLLRGCQRYRRGGHECECGQFAEHGVSLAETVGRHQAGRLK